MNPNTPAIELVFSKPPSNRKAMVHSLMARRPALAVAERRKVRFHAVWTGAQADPAAVRAYMALCDGDGDGAIAPVCVPAAPAGPGALGQPDRDAAADGPWRTHGLGMHAGRHYRI
jgi:hypothetical protein